MRSEDWHPPDPARLARMGVLATLMVVPLLVLDAAAQNADLGPLILGALAVLASSAVLTAVLTASGRRGAATAATFYVWNAVAMAALSLYVIQIGGDPRRYGVLYGLVMGLAATLFPPRGQWILQPVAMLSYGAVLVASDLTPWQITLQLGLMAAVAWMLVEGAVRLKRVAAAERDARVASERHAGLAAALTRLTSLDPDELMDRIVDAVIGVGFELATIGVVRDGYLLATRHRGFTGASEPYAIPADRGLAGRAMSERRTVAVADYLEFEERLPDRDTVRSAIAVPLLRGDEVIGALIGGRSVPGEMNPSDIAAMEVLAVHAGHALVNARRFDSERRTVERLTELEAMKAEFVSNVSHELRTPLTVIHGVGETLAVHGDALDDERRRDLLARLNENSARLSTMITALLDFSKFEAGAVELSVEPVALQPVLSGVLRRLEPVLEGHHVVADVADVAVLADPGLFEHVIENLVGNAHTHTPPGTTVQVRAVREGEAVRISVGDDGPGIPPDQLTRITERFYRGGPSGSRPSGGVGLGLALCEQILAVHGTALEVSSEVGAGTEFSFLLPVAVGASSGRSAPADAV